MMQNSYPCRECQAGLIRLQHVTYFTWLKDELITVPNFPAWVCDVCGKREYDQRAISWLTMLLNPNTGNTAKPKHPPSKKTHKSESVPTTRPK